MKKLLLLASLLMMFASCDNAAGPGNTANDSLWPYQIGDTYTLSAETDPDAELVYTVTGDTVIDGKTWLKHECDPDFLLTVESSPEPIPLELTLSRTEGDLLFLIIWGDSLVLDLSGKTFPSSPGFLLMQFSGTMTMTFPAGTFGTCYDFDAGAAKHTNRMLLAPGVGIVRTGGDDVGLWQLQRAKIGGRSYP